jgi:superoxide dismutase, Cu-Zn family
MTRSLMHSRFGGGRLVGGTFGRRASGALLGAAVAAAAAACARSAPPTASAEVRPIIVTETRAATAELRDSTGAVVGTARMSADSNGTIRLVLHVDRMTPGAHGVHFHSVGNCTPAGGFSAAGPHHNPLNRKHGLQNPDGPHAGDLPNLTVGANGSGDLDTETARATLRSGPATLLDADGSAIVVHAGEDDQRTDPAGNSGARVACGVVTKL